ncbi:hypothetical protein C7458_105465 [Williamsia muralis]|nr:hypothetical protein C7458_105465 [Williamsia marianensis]
MYASDPPAPDGCPSADRHPYDLSPRMARDLLEHLLIWAPFGGAEAADIFIRYGVSRTRYLALVDKAFRLVGHEHDPESRTQIARAVACQRNTTGSTN